MEKIDENDARFEFHKKVKIVRFIKYGE